MSERALTEYERKHLAPLVHHAQVTAEQAQAAEAAARQARQALGLACALLAGEGGRVDLHSNTVFVDDEGCSPARGSEVDANAGGS